MAGYKGHVAGAALFCGVYVALLIVLMSAGLLAAAAAGVVQSQWHVIGIFVVAMLFGLWPDVDTNSRGQDIFFAGIFILDVLLIATGNLEIAAYLGLLAMLPIIGKHRGWTHSFWAMFLVPLPILLVPYLNNSNNLPLAGIYYGAAVAGYFSHLFFDGRVGRLMKRFA